jgi:tRNA-Thr(GGU) m(6)t(6)A37 methyltransferase TsaA
MPETAGCGLSWRLVPIGMVRTQFLTPAEVPRDFERVGRATVEIFPDFVGGMGDLEGFSHLWLVTLLNQIEGFDLRVTPRGGGPKRGLFATRSPRRPNPIGMTLVELLRVEEPFLHVVGADLLDGTPLLDLKPYLPKNDSVPDARCGWIGKRGLRDPLHEPKGEGRC